MTLSDLIPHAPHVGLYAGSSIPKDKLANAIGDYAKEIAKDDVLALYDATLMGSAKDGAVFARDRLVFQNNDLQPVHEVRYEDIVQVDSKRKLLGGRRLLIMINRGRATFQVEMDFSGKPQAADYVLRFLREIMLHPDAMESATGGDEGRDSDASGHRSAVDTDTDVTAVSSALRKLRDEGLLSRKDFDAINRLLER